jgi:hypothetical protein
MNTHFMILVLNCILIQNNVRGGFLIQNHDIIESTVYTISNTYSTLNQRNTSYGILVTKNKLNNEYDNKDDIDYNYKLGKLLGYPTYKQFPISKKDKANGYYTYHVKVVLINNEKITLFSFVAKDLSTENKIYELLSHIKDTLYDSEYSNYIKNIYLDRIKKYLK